MSTEHHHSNEVQTLYEGDQSKLYSGLLNHVHGESVESQGSKDQIKRIWKVFWILLIVTVVEVVLGMYGYRMGVPKAVTASLFLIMTLFKAAYIVRIFMHLGDELRNFLITVMIPLTLFIWFIIAFLADGGFWLHMNNANHVR